MAAWRICDEVRGALPWQKLMHGSSVLTLRAELAQFARLHVPGLAEDAEEEAAVEAARQALASGWLLLVDDVGPDLEGVLVGCPTHALVCQCPLGLTPPFACAGVAADPSGRLARWPRAPHDDRATQLVA